MKQIDSGQHNSKWTIRKFQAFDDLTSEEVYKRWVDGKPGAQPFEVREIPDNILINVGITEMWNLIIGEAAAPYNNANSQIGVGSDATAEDATQIGLIDVSAAFVGMEASFPVLAGQSVTWRGVYDGATANFDWREFSVANGSPATTGIQMNRKVDTQGTKAPGQTWTLDLAITLS